MIVNKVRLTKAQLQGLADMMGDCGKYSEITIEEVHEEDSSGTHTKSVYGTFKRQTNAVAKTGRLYHVPYNSQ